MIEITYYEIPEFLYQGHLYKNFSSNFNEDNDIKFAIPKNAFKRDLNVHNIDDWIFLFDTSNYWGIQFPSVLLEYYVYNIRNINEYLNETLGQNSETIIEVKKIFEKYFLSLKEKEKSEWYSKQFNYFITIPKIIQNAKFNYISHNPYITREMIENNLDLPWDFNLLVENEKMSVDFILSHRNKFTDLTMLGGNPNVTWDTVINHPEIQWDFYYLSKNPSITWDVIINNPDFPWDFGEALSARQDLTWEVINRYPLDIWYGKYLSSNPNITIQNIMDTWDIIEWDLSEIPNEKITLQFLEFISIFEGEGDYIGYNCSYSCITWDYIVSHPYIYWYYDFLSYNPNITWEIVSNNLDKKWSWRHLTEKMPFEFIKNNPNQSWDYQKLNYISKITWNDVLSNPQIPWNYEFLSKNPNITWDIIQNNPNHNWSIVAFSENPNLTMEILEQNPTLKWNYKIISYNKLLTWEFVYNHSQLDWDYLAVIRNDMSEAFENYFKNKYLL